MGNSNGVVELLSLGRVGIVGVRRAIRISRAVLHLQKSSGKPHRLSSLYRVSTANKMASTSKSAVILCQAFLELIFLLAACSARDTIGKSYDAAMTPSEHPYLSKLSPSTVSQCNKAYSVREAETCHGVMKMFKVNEKNFYSINPNVECDHLFVRQWLCVKEGGLAN